MRGDTWTESPMRKAWKHAEDKIVERVRVLEGRGVWITALTVTIEGTKADVRLKHRIERGQVRSDFERQLEDFRQKVLLEVSFPWCQYRGDRYVFRLRLIDGKMERCARLSANAHAPRAFRWASQRYKGFATDRSSEAWDSLEPIETTRPPGAPMPEIFVPEEQER